MTVGCKIIPSQAFIPVFQPHGKQQNQKPESAGWLGKYLVMLVNAVRFPLVTPALSPDFRWLSVAYPLGFPLVTHGRLLLRSWLDG